MSWQDDKSWSEIDAEIQAEQDKKEEQERERPHGEIHISVYNDDDSKFSLWGFLKRIFGKKD